MKLNNYIVASLLSHLLVFGVLIMFYREMNTELSVPVFDIDIVGPIEEEVVVPQAIKKTPPKSLSYIRKSTPKTVLEKTPEERKLSPETMFGEGTDKEGILPEGSKGLSLKPKSFLFDKETIEKYAQKKTIKGKGLTFDAPELHHRGYMRMLKDKLESIWKYPEEAARRGISGDLYIRFSIHRDGSLGEVELIRTSGYRDLDEAAMKALKDAVPYWPLPDDWKEDELSITGHFIYLIGEFYVM